MSESGVRIENGEMCTVYTVTVSEIGIHSTFCPWGFYAIKKKTRY